MSAHPILSGLLALGGWYAIVAALFVWVMSRPGSLVSAERNEAVTLTPAVWAVVGALWPWFSVRWLMNTMRNP